MDQIQNSNHFNRLRHASINIYYDTKSTKQELLKDLKNQVEIACDSCGCFSPQLQKQALKAIEKPVTELKALEILSEECEENPSFVCPTTSDDEYQQLGRELEMRVIKRARYVFEKYFRAEDPEVDNHLLSAEARLKQWGDYSSNDARLLREKLLQASKYEPSKKPCLSARYSPSGGIFVLASDPYYQKNYRADLIEFGWGTKLTSLVTLDDLFFAGTFSHSLTIANFMEDQCSITYAMPDSSHKREVIPFVDTTSKDMWGVIHGETVMTYDLNRADYHSDLDVISIKQPYFLKDNNYSEGFGVFGKDAVLIGYGKNEELIRLMCDELGASA